MLLSVIFLSTLMSIALAGRFYCGWLCPFGALSEFLSRLPLQKWSLPREVDDGWRNVKYLLFGLVAVVVLLSGKVAFGNFETYVTLFSFHGTAFTWAIVVVALLANLRVRRFWCRYLCPVAALAGLFSRKDPIYVSTGDCPMANRHAPLNSECIRCNRCCK
jgi:polyferredoxin